MEEKRREILAGNTHIFSVLSLHSVVSSFQNHLIAKNSISYMHCMLEKQTTAALHGSANLWSNIPGKQREGQSYLLFSVTTWNCACTSWGSLHHIRGATQEYKTEWSWLTTREKNQQGSLLPSWLTLVGSSSSSQGYHLELMTGTLD